MGGIGGFGGGWIIWLGRIFVVLEMIDRGGGRGFGGWEMGILVWASRVSRSIGGVFRGTRSLDY
jgi:hypothetical protein